MKSTSKLSKSEKQNRKDVYTNIRDAFAEKYSFLGAQAARELLMSAASWNIDKYSDPNMRYRNHVMLTWEPGWLKSTLINKMQKVLGEELVSTVGKLTAAVLRGSVKGGKFSPPTPMKSPIVASTEFGQTDFDDELHNTLLTLLEEGKTNVSLNKIAGMSESLKENVEKKYDEQIQFKAENEFTLEADFVFWGATHDPSLLTEYALKSRFNVVTPSKPLIGEVTASVDNSRSVETILDKSDIKLARRAIRSKKEAATSFKPPKTYYTEYSLSPRMARDVQSYMAARNWWGLDVSPDIMQNYIEELKRSRRIADMSPEQRVKNLIFDNPMTYDQIQKKTGYRKIEIHNIFEKIDAKVAGTDPEKTNWVVRSGERTRKQREDTADFLKDL